MLGCALPPKLVSTNRETGSGSGRAGVDYPKRPELVGVVENQMKYSW